MTDTESREGLLSYFGSKADQVAVDGKMLVPYRTRQIYQHTCEYRPDKNGIDKTYVPPAQIGFTEVYDRITDKLVGVIDGAHQFIKGQKNANGEFVCQALNPQTKKPEIQTFLLADNILTDVENTPGLREVSFMFTEDWKPYGSATEKEITPISSALEKQAREKGLQALEKIPQKKEVRQKYLMLMPERCHD